MFVVVVAGIVAAHGVDGLFMCTMMTGVQLVVLGITSMGSAVKFIPRPIVIGFTNEIAVLIASTQVKDFFGLRLQKVPGEFWLRIKSIGSYLSDVVASRHAAGRRHGCGNAYLHARFPIGDLRRRAEFDVRWRSRTSSVFRKSISDYPWNPVFFPDLTRL